MFAMGGRIGATGNVGNTTKPGKFSSKSYAKCSLYPDLGLSEGQNLAFYDTHFRAGHSVLKRF